MTEVVEVERPGAPSGLKSLPRVTVAVCTRDRVESLEGCLASLAGQTHEPHEILVVDNGRGDAVAACAARVVPSARVVREPCAGLDFARNRALATASGDVIAFADDDVQLDPGWVRAIAESFATVPDAGAVTGLILPLELATPAQELFEANGGYGRGSTRRILPADGEVRLGVQLPAVSDSLTVGSGCNMAFRISVLKALGGFDEALDWGPELPGGGDLDAFYRVLRSGSSLVYEPRALARHRHRRTLPELRVQLVGHRKALSAFLVKTVRTERGPARASAFAFAVWRHLKDAWRLVRGALGRDPLPLPILGSLFVAGWIGLGSYPASRARLRRRVRRTGGSRTSFGLPLGELWHFRDLIWNLAARDLKVKYQRSWLGFLWTLLNPIVTVAILVAVFSYVIRIPLESYWAFLLSGYFAWSFFSQTLNGGVQSAVGSAYLTRSASFPPEALVLAAAIARLLEFVLELAIVVVVLAAFHHGALPASLVGLLVLVPILFLLALGLALPLVGLAARFQDAVQAVPLAVTALFYASPVFYPLELVPTEWRALYLLNPMASVLHGFQTVLYRGELPPAGLLLALACVACAVCLAGLVIFGRSKRELAEIV